MEMRIDEARDADHPGAVDDLSRGRLDPLGDGDDRAVADMHVAAGEVGHGRIHGEHGGAADDELAARRQRRARRCGIARSLCEERARRERCGRQRGGALQKPAPVQCHVCHVHPPDMLGDDIRNGGTRKEEAVPPSKLPGGDDVGQQPVLPARICAAMKVNGSSMTFRRSLAA